MWHRSPRAGGCKQRKDCAVLLALMTEGRLPTEGSRYPGTVAGHAGRAAAVRAVRGHPVHHAAAVQRAGGAHAARGFRRRLRCAVRGRRRSGRRSHLRILPLRSPPHHPGGARGAAGEHVGEAAHPQHPLLCSPGIHAAPTCSEAASERGFSRVVATCTTANQWLVTLHIYLYCVLVAEGTALGAMLSPPQRIGLNCLLPALRSFMSHTQSRRFSSEGQMQQAVDPVERQGAKVRGHGGLLAGVQWHHSGGSGRGAAGGGARPLPWARGDAAGDSAVLGPQLRAV